MRQNESRIIGGFIFFILSTLIWIGAWILCPNEYYIHYLCLLGCHLFLCICMIFVLVNKEFYIFEPIVFVLFMYYMIFVFTPIINILTDNMDIFGTNTMEGCMKGTFVFVIGFISLMIGYNKRIRLVLGGVEQGLCVKKKHVIEYDKKSLLKYSYFIWGGAVGIYLVYNLMTGRNLLYMLSFGFLSKGMNMSQGYTVDFLSMIIYCSFLPMMNILIIEESKLLKFFVYFVTCVPVATRGFRSVLIIPLLAPFIYYYVKYKKTPRIKVLFGVLGMIILMLGVIANTRSSMRIGNGLYLKNYSYLDGIEGVLDYFGSYKAFYGAVMKYPSVYKYTYGAQMLYSLIMYIPRFFWPGKPSGLIQEVIGNSTNEIARASGSAWPNIGEYYTDGGILSVVIWMSILGIVFRKMKKMYESSTQSYVIAYCLLLPGLIPVIAYGYTAGNLPTIVFMLLPLLGQRYFVRYRKIYNPEGEI